MPQDQLPRRRLFREFFEVSNNNPGRLNNWRRHWNRNERATRNGLTAALPLPIFQIGDH